MESRIKGSHRGHNQPVKPPVTPHEPSDPTPKPRSPRKRKPAPDTPDAPPAPKAKAKRQADEGERTRPPIPAIDGRLARAVADARRLNGLTQTDIAGRMGMAWASRVGPAAPARPPITSAIHWACNLRASALLVVRHVFEISLPLPGCRAWDCQLPFGR